MKHIKLYEDRWSDDYKKYWLLPTDRRFKKSLRQIGCNQNYIDIVSKMKNRHDQKYIYISNDNEDWGWMPYNKRSIEWFEKRDYIFSGNINIELDTKIDKYNL